MEDIKNNKNQLDVLKTSMTSVFKYQDSIDRENGRRSIPRTWSDLNKYTLFYWLNDLSKRPLFNLKRLNLALPCAVDKTKFEIYFVRKYISFPLFLFEFDVFIEIVPNFEISMIRRILTISFSSLRIFDLIISDTDKFDPFRYKILLINLFQ